MATLVLSGVGGATAGSLGAAVGRVAGREIDNSLRRGNRAGRLSDLRVLTSHYGATIPAVYGRMRVAGTVIWATELIENALVSKSGSGRAYSVSFAVALSSRELLSVKRIWADGRLIRGAGGDHKTRFKVRFHSGNEDQLADPLIVSLEGSDQAPAYRGLALLVFEDFDLSTFGNRLPQITAEVDAGDQLNVSSVLAARGVIRPRLVDTATKVGGYALDGDDVGEAISPLLLAFSPRFSPRGLEWENEPEATTVDVAESEILKDAEGFSRTGEEPFSRISVRYFDASLDYAIGEKSAHLPTTDQRHVLRLEIPGVLDSDLAKGLAQARLSEECSSRHERTLALPLCRSAINLGDRIKLPDRAYADLEVRSKSLTAENVQLVLGATSSPAKDVRSEPGRSNAEADVPPRPLSLFMIELPKLDGSGEAVVGVGAITSERSAGAIPISLEVAGTIRQAVSPTISALRGRLLAPLVSSAPDAFDMEQKIAVEVENDDWLASCSEEALLGGANLVRIGDEFLQFGAAEPIAPGIFRVSKLLRGRFASDIPTAHPVGTLMFLLEEGRLASIRLGAETIGSQLTATCIDLADRQASASLTFTGAALRPSTPAHLEGRRDGSGLMIKWIRRSRLGSAWLDNVEAPLGESRELYRVEVTSAELKSGVRELVTPELVISQNELDELGNAPFRVTVQHVGDFGVSLPAQIIIS